MLFFLPARTKQVSKLKAKRSEAMRRLKELGEEVGALEAAVAEARHDAASAAALERGYAAQLKEVT